jgi:pimeloyl-ACP methyl ester carboxylesterase
MNHSTFLLVARLCLVLTTAAGSYLQAQQIPAAVVSDLAPDRENPASMEAPDVPSHGAKMYSVLYLAAGAGTHPTVVLMHGFPGNEQNMDLAYSIRRAGWNVLVPHCRGAWGSEGAYSFTHAIEDTQAAVQFLRDPENVKKYRIDPKRLVLIGHSLGGFLVAYATARDSEIMGVGMIAASNLGPSTMRAWARDPQEIQARFRDNASRLAGTTSERLLEEAKQNAASWNYLDYAPALKDRPVLIVEADDRNLSDNQALAAALRKLGNSRITETHMTTDHIFSDYRIALQGVVVEWLEGVVAQKAK